MKEFARKILHIFIIALVSIFLGFISVIAESKSFDNDKNMSLCMVILSAFLFFFFIAIYIKLEHKETLRKEEEERRRIIDEPRNRFNQIHLKYPKSSSIVLEKYSTPSSQYTFRCDYVKALNELDAKKDNLLEEEERLDQIFKIYRYHYMAYTHFLKEQNIKTHWMDGIKFIPCEQADIDIILGISDNEWENMDKQPT